MEHFYDFVRQWRILFVLVFVSLFINSCTDENIMIERGEDYVFIETYAGNINNSARLEITPESSESAPLQLKEQLLEFRVKLFCENSSSNYRLYKIKLLLNDEDILLERETSSIKLYIVLVFSNLNLSHILKTCNIILMINPKVKQPLW